MARYAKKANNKVPKYGVGGYIGAGVGALAGTGSLYYGIDQARKKNNPQAAAGIIGSLIGYGGGAGAAAWQYFQNKEEAEALQAANAEKARILAEQNRRLEQQRREQQERQQQQETQSQAKARFIQERDKNAEKPLEQKISDNQGAMANARSNTKSGNAQIYSLPNPSVYGGRSRYPKTDMYALPNGQIVSGEQLASWVVNSEDPNSMYLKGFPRGLPWATKMAIHSGDMDFLEQYYIPDYQPTQTPLADGGYAPRFGYGGYIAGGLAGLGAAGMAGTGAYQGIKKKDYGSLAAGLTGAALSGLAAEELIRGQYNQNVAEEKQDEEVRRLFQDAVVEDAAINHPKTFDQEIASDDDYQIGNWRGKGSQLLPYMFRYHDPSFDKFPHLKPFVRNMMHQHTFPGISPEQIQFLESRNFDRLKVPIQPPIQEAPSDSSSSLAHGGYAPRYNMGGAITAGIPAALFAVGSLPLGAMAYDDFDKGRKDDGIMKTAAAISSVGAGIGLGIHAVNEYPWYEWDSAGYHNAQDIANGRKLVWPPNQEEENQENPQTPTAPQATPAPQVQPVQQAATPVTYNFGGRHFTKEQLESIERKIQTFPDGGMSALIRQGFTPDEARDLILGPRAWENHESSNASQVPSPNASAFTSRVMSAVDSSSDDPGDHINHGMLPPGPPKADGLAHGGYAPRYGYGGYIGAGVLAGATPFLGYGAYDQIRKGNTKTGALLGAGALASGIGAGVSWGLQRRANRPPEIKVLSAEPVENAIEQFKRENGRPPVSQEELFRIPIKRYRNLSQDQLKNDPKLAAIWPKEPWKHQFEWRTKAQLDALRDRLGIDNMPVGVMRAHPMYNPETMFALNRKEYNSFFRLPKTKWEQTYKDDPLHYLDTFGIENTPNPSNLADGGYAPRFASGGIHPWAIAAGLPAMGVGGLTDVLALSGALDNYSPRNKKGEVQRWPWVLGGSALGLGGLGSLTYGVGGFEGSGSNGTNQGGPSLGERIDAQDPSMFSNAIKEIGDFFNKKGYTLPVVPRNLLGLKILNSGKGGWFRGIKSLYNSIDTNALSRGGKVPRYVMGGGISEVGGFDPMEEERKKQLLNWQMQMSQQQQMFDQQQMMEDQDVPMEADGGRSPRYLDTVIPGAMGLGSVPRYDIGGALAEVLPAIQGAAGSGATEGAVENAISGIGNSGPLSFWEMLMKKKKLFNIKDILNKGEGLIKDITQGGGSPEEEAKLATAIQEGSTQDAIKDAVAQADPRISEWEAMKGNLKQKGGKLLEKGAETLGQVAGSVFGGPLGGLAGKYLVKAGVGGYQLWKKHRDAMYAQQVQDLLDSFKESGSGLQERQLANAALTANAARNMLATSKGKRAANFRMLAEGGEAPRFEGVNVPSYFLGGKNDEEDDKIIKEASEGVGNDGIDWNKWNPMSGSQGNYYQPYSTIAGTNKRGGAFFTDDDGISRYRMTNNPFDIYNKIRYSRTMRHGVGGAISKAVPFGVGLFHPFTGAAYGTAKSLLGLNPTGMALSGIPLAGMLGSMYAGASNPMKFGWRDLKENFTNNMDSWAIPGIWRKRTGNMFYDAMNAARAATIAAPLLI